MINIFACSAKLSIYVPKFYRWFQDHIFHVAGADLACGLVFDMKEVSVMLNADNPISWLPFQVPFARLCILEVHSVTNFEGGWCAVYSLVGSLESIFIKCFLCNC